MPAAFEYRPKFVDIRVKKPDAAAETPRAPGERACDHVGCGHAGAHRAPKSRTQDSGFWWFCLEHASDYNRRWNYFAGMSDAELSAYDRAEAAGHRPTWTFRAAKGDRLSAAYRNFQAGKRRDPFGVFSGDSGPGGGGARAERDDAPRLSRLQLLALETLDLQPGVDAAAIRIRYAELVKRYHPDSNGGDRTMETQLHKVIRAFQTLKSSGLVA